jgi:C_GCAxxG_C_C family probable redox protein
MNIDIEQRAERAVSYFKEGYNCSQSVFMAYSDLYGIESDMAAKFASSFGGGMGLLREVCGACTGMFMIASMQIPANVPTDKKAKSANYVLVQELAEEFRRENGSIICRELLGLDHKKDEPQLDVRTETLCKKRPCVELVRLAAEIIGRKLQSL